MSKNWYYILKTVNISKTKKLTLKNTNILNKKITNVFSNLSLWDIIIII